MSVEFIQQTYETISLIVTFLIFFWILKKFAWGPILSTIDARQRKIQDAFDEVKALQAEAAEAHRRYEEKLRHIEEEARQKIQEAVADGRRVAAEVTEQARKDALAIVEKAQANVALELAKARKQLHEDVVRLTLGATEKLIRQRLDPARDRELVAAFIQELEGES